MFSLVQSWTAIKWGLAVIGLAAVAALVLLARHQSAQITDLKVDLKGATESAAAWQSAHKLQIDLAQKTAEARAAETRALLTIRDAAGTAKQGIVNAPGASDRFRYSDSAYRFMRDHKDAEPAAAAAPAVD